MTWSYWWELFTEALPAGLGALVSLRFSPGQSTHKARWVSGLCAYIIGAYLGRGIVAYYMILNAHVANAIVFGVSLFGLSFTSAATAEMRPLIIVLRQRFAGATLKEGLNATDKSN